MLEPRSGSGIRSCPKEGEALLKDLPDYPWGGTAQPLPTYHLLWLLTPHQTTKETICQIVFLEDERKEQTSGQPCLVLPPVSMSRAVGASMGPA